MKKLYRHDMGMDGCYGERESCSFSAKVGKLVGYSVGIGLVGFGVIVVGFADGLLVGFGVGIVVGCSVITLFTLV